jgi:4-diphosphocytidyl-2-C-methyl-D-erythritol kinase
VEKRIPIGGGLGGGSSNAAATLLTLNKLAGFPFGQENQGRQALLEMAASLGSDVPFFIHETGAAWVTGRGEKIEPIEVPPVFLVLVNPGFPSATSMAFRLLDQYRSQNFHTETQRIQRHGAVIPNLFSVPSCPPCLRVMKWGNVDFRNDFIEVFPQREKSIYYEIISQLMGLGAEFASLSGAGASCFGVFSQKELAMKAVEVLKGKWEFVQHCNSFNY